MQQPNASYFRPATQTAPFGLAANVGGAFLSSVGIEARRSAARRELHSNNQRGGLTSGGLRNSKGWARTSVISLVAALTLCTPLSAQQLIRCPDWKALVEQERVYATRKAPPKQSFDAALKANVSKAPSAPSPILASAQGSGKPQTQASKSKSSPLRASMRKTSSAPAACPTHVVKSGDTLGVIAKTYLGSSARYPEIATLNGIKVATALRVGQKLTIPCSGTGAGERSASLGVAAKPSGPAPTPPLPVWRGKSGEYLTDVFRRWGKSAGYKVVKEGSDDWRLSVPVAVQGTFEEALQQVVRGFEDTGRPPGVSIYSNKVVKVGAP